MPILIILLLAVLIASFGFWNTLQAILGAIGLLVFLFIVFLATIAAFAVWLMNRSGRRFTGR